MEMPNGPARLVQLRTPTEWPSMTSLFYLVKYIFEVVLQQNG